MINDKEITLSCAGSRKATLWKPRRLMWSEFITRVSQPAISPETFQEYKAMKKAQQDELKDVGGYVGGLLEGNRRKNSCLISRSLITLDADNIPAGQTDDILRRVAALGCAYAVYSTRKHEGAAPRIRIVIPADRDMIAEEYEPVARKLASLIGMDIFDPTTFQGIRFMYWPSRCSDGEWVFKYGDNPFLNVNGILKAYGDWRNVKEWPEVPGIQKMIIQGGRKQGDPREKGKQIGAFCRVYDIPAAIEKFLPDIYEHCGNDRYTYKAGSTSAGAVLYDDGQFLYSNHATDPAGGRLCNSFDLIRIHLFGNLDDEAKPDTPPHKLPSYRAMCEFVLKDESVYEEYISAAFNKTGAEGVEPYPDIKVGAQGAITILPTADNLKVLLHNFGIHISYDLIKRKTEVKCRDATLEERFNASVNGYNNLLTFCADQFARDGLRTTTGRIHEWVVAIADEDRRNAAKEYLESVGSCYAGTREIDALFQCLYVQGDADLYKMLLRKWLCQCVAMAHNERGCFGADGVLVLKGPHGIGKTTFFRRCCAIGQKYFAEGVALDGSKDRLMEATQCWIGELGELPRSLKDLDSMKAFVTSPSDKFRAPYGKKAEVYPRLTSFGATTNSDSFLKEDTERRFWVIDALDIDLDALARINFDAVWAEAVALYRLLGSLSFRLTEAERTALRQQNKQYQIITEEEAILRDKLDWNQPREQWKEFTATALCELVAPGRGLSPVKIGQALKRIGYAKDSEGFPLRIIHGCPTYLVPGKTITLFG